MKIAVCIKQVPDTTTKIKIKDDGLSIAEEGVKFIVSPYDEFGIEEAIRLKEKNPTAETLAVTVGPKRAAEALRTALAMGIDKATHIQAEGYMDPLSVAKLLAAKLKQENPDVIFTGRLAIDDDNSQVSQMVAELLNIPHVTVVSQLELDVAQKTAKAERDIEGGSKECWSVNLPAVLAAGKGLNQPRYASLKGIMSAKSKPLETLTPEQLGGVPVAKVITGKYVIPEQKRMGKIFKDNPAQAVNEVVKLLREEAKVI